MAMITRPKTSAIPTVPSPPPYSASATIAPQPAKTRAKAARPSARARRARSGLVATHLFRRHLAEQRLHALLDLVADPAHTLEVRVGRIVELPILVALAGVDRAGVAAPHRDHGVRRPHHLVGEWLGELLPEVHADLGHRLAHRGVDLVGGLAARRANVDPAPPQLVHQACGHLAAAGVLDADEQNLGDLLRHHALHLRQGAESFTGKAVYEQRDEVLEADVLQRIQRLLDIALDRLAGEDPRELVGQRV